jgi:tight adherence protein C
MRATLAVGGIALAACLALVTPVATISAPLLGGVGMAVPGRWLARRRRARGRAVVRELPDLLDLLGICIEAGMALDPALRLAGERLGGTLGEETAVVLRDLSLGTQRRVAYGALVERVVAPELSRTVGALLQAEELGAPLSRALQGQAEALRAARRQEARESAARAAPKIQLVVAMVMVPAVLLLVLGVLLIELSRQVGAVVG